MTFLLKLVDLGYRVVVAYLVPRVLVVQVVNGFTRLIWLKGLGHADLGDFVLFCQL